ncbi:unnamed protein product, partial [Didymodactylos carnosus]
RQEFCSAGIGCNLTVPAHESVSLKYDENARKRISTAAIKIQWNTVIRSFLLQFLLAMIVMRTRFGFEFFQFLGNEVSSFMDSVIPACTFVYGQNYLDHFFVFKITSIIIFLAAIIGVLYYYGIIQAIISKIAWFLQYLLNTTAAESVFVVASVFLGMSEAPLLIQPLISKLTPSELHVPATHLIAACVMAAPGALGFSKLLFPETRKSITTWDNVKNVQLHAQNNVVEALITGAVNGLKISGFVIAALIAFISVLTLTDNVISWIFSLVQHPEVNFQYLLGLAFYPFALLTGIPMEDCFVSSNLIGIKISLNEVMYGALVNVLKCSEYP